MIAIKRGGYVPLTITKDFVADQTWKDFTLKFNASAGFDVTKGVGHSGSTTTAIICNYGGYPNVRVTATGLLFHAPTTAGAEDIGVMFRYRCLDSPANYYYARLFHGTAMLYKISAGVFSLLNSGAFALPVDTDMTIVCTAIGPTLQAVFTSPGITTVTLNATDSTHTNGSSGIVSISSGVWCKTFKTEQLP